MRLSQIKTWLKADPLHAILLAIIVVAAILRLYNITLHDSYTDEVLYSFRGLGLIDYDTSPTQTTPWQWFTTVPCWTHLSFHDHPLLFFLMEFISLKIFGINLFAVRLPSILAGLTSIILLYLILEKLFNKKTAILGALLLSVNSYHIWLSRLGLQDGVVIMFILLAWDLWLRIADNKKYWLWLGLIMGLGILTKYTFLIAFPFFLLHAFIYKNPIYKERNFWLATLIIFFTTTPVWLYNLMLYAKRGHFDFQISAMLNQQVPEWTFRMGRVLTGTTADKFKNFFVVLNYGNSIWINILIVFAFVALIYWLFKKKDKIYWFLLSANLLFFLWFLVIGSTFRFVIMIMPLLFINCALLLYRWQEKNKLSLYIFLIIFISAEIFFSTNSFLLNKSYGPANIAYAKINLETQNYGFNQLENYLKKKLDNSYSLYAGQPEYDFLIKLAKKNLNKKKDASRPALGIFITYDKRLNFLAALWTLDRRMYYDSYPIVDEILFTDTTKGKYDEYYRAMGVQNFIYVQAASNQVCSLDYKDKKLADSQLAVYLKNKGIKPIVIKNSRGEDSFYVYEF